MIKNIFWLALLLTFANCSGTKKVAKKVPTTGIIKYAIQIEPKEGVPVSAETFGRSATVNFNQEVVHFKKDDGEGAEETFQLTEVATGTERNYLNFQNKKYVLTTTPDMLPDISELVFQNEKKQILGMECQKATATMGDELLEVWFTNEIGVDFCPYVSAKGFALQYSLPMPFGRVTYTATDAKLNTNDPALLIAPSDYKAMTLMELQKELSSGGMTAMGEGEIAPTFIAKDMDGKMVDLNSLKGKVVLLNFWFINCAPCRMEMPDLNELKAEYAEKDVVFIGITFDQQNDIEAFLKKIPFEFQLIPDARQIIDEYAIQGFPTSIVLDRNGIVVDSKVGGSFNIKEELKAFIEKAL